jgi:hypothetical protein
MLWQFKQSEDHKPTAKVARALEALDDHVFRQGPMDEKTLSEHHRTLHEAYQDLDPEDRAHVKMRLPSTRSARLRLMRRLMLRPRWLSFRPR